MNDLIVNIILVEVGRPGSGEDGAQVSHGNTLKMTSGQFDDIAHAVSQSVSGKVSPGLISSVAPDAMYVTDTFTKVNLPGGNHSRFRVMINVREERPGGDVVISDITGYTDHAELSFSGELDPNMVLYLDSVQLYNENYIPGSDDRNLTNRGGFTMITAETPDIQMVENTYNAEPANILTRPVDVILGVGLNDPVRDDMGGGDLQVTNMVSTADKHMKVSRLENAMGAYTLSTTINAFQSAEASAKYGHDDEDIMHNALGAAVEYNAGGVAFLRRLSDSLHAESVTDCLMSDISEIDPNATVKIITKNQAPTAVRELSGSEFEYNDIISPEQTAASFISENVSALLVKAGMTFAAFSMISETHDRHVFTTPMDFSAYSGRPVTVQMIQRFLASVEDLVIPAITHNYQTSVEIVVVCEINASTRVRVSIDGGPLIPFYIATYAKSKTTSVRSTHDEFNNMVYSVDRLRHELSDDY